MIHVKKEFLRYAIEKIVEARVDKIIE